MPSHEEAREYLRGALEALGVPMKEASLALGRNHAYIEQYLREGKPRWLHQQDREALVRLWPQIDGERIRPPLPAFRRVALGNGHDKPQIESPRIGELIDQPGAFDLLEAFRRIRDPHMRAMAIQLVSAMGKPDSAIIS